ncbi:MAG: ROK family protein [Propionibacteriaceae bacterium]|jgi:predicted NBD/HSP70 family sugar kinase|nr:ROK family protein [Propionibacteriaceae bacterium]
MFSLGIDIGATKAHGVVLDAANKVVAEHAVFSRRGEQGVTAVLMEIANTVAADVGVQLSDFTSVGVGIAGVVNREAGEVTNGVNLDLHNFRLVERVAEFFSVPIKIDNDVKATVIAAGMILDSPSVTYVNFGTGVAAATLDGRLIRGHDNLAGEIGHIILDPHGEPCRCGKQGCIETITGGAYLAPRMDALGLDWTTLNEDQSPLGQAALDQAVRAIARVVAFVSLAYSSDHVLLGGGVVQAAPWLLPTLKDFLVHRAHLVFPDYVLMASKLEYLAEDLQIAAIGAALIGQGHTEGYQLPNSGHCTS